ncbi:MAG: MBL fold metallo-hydrolase [Clostridia bacterium]|nr:MBL fold metallo-hydrolase [Clostridia bacterium]
MIIKTLLENTTSCPGILCEHGLSLLIELPNMTILFDSGASGLFAVNANLLREDLSRVDLMILSHAHSDHGGGIRTFLSLNDHAPVYVSRYAFDGQYNSKGLFNGIDLTLKNDPRIRMLGTYTKLSENAEVFSCNDRPPKHKIIPFGLQMKENGKLVPEDFRHEQYLVLTDNGKRVVISGCSHKGVLNVMDWLRPDILIGGFHFMKVEFDKEGCAFLDNACRELLSYDCEYYTCHCTGLEQYDYLKEQMGDRLHYLSGGMTLTL